MPKKATTQNRVNAQILELRWERDPIWKKRYVTLVVVDPASHRGEVSRD